MSKIDGIGFTKEFTKKKIDDLKVIFEYHLVVTNAVLQKYPNYPQFYQYIDLTSGKGVIPDIGYGSPLLLIESVQNTKIDLPIKMDLIEKEEINIIELRNNLDAFNFKNKQQFNIEVINGEYQQEIENLVRKKTNEFGLAYIDHSGNMPDIGSLNFVAENRPKMELLIYLSATNVKRVEQYTKLKLIDIIQSINKKNWFVRKEQKRDKHQFIFLLGTNSDGLFRKYKKISFYPIKSEEGKYIIDRLNLTKVEFKQKIQPSLFEQ